MGHSALEVSAECSPVPKPVPVDATQNFSRCVLINARSLEPKLQEFRFLLSSGQFDLVLVTETWLSDSTPDSLINNGLPYNIVRRDRGSRGGGLLVAIKDCLNFGSSNLATDVEGLFIDLLEVKTRLILGYIPNSYDYLYVSNMCSFLRSSMHDSFSNLITGDFNMSFINWTLRSATHPSGSAFLDCTSELG